MKKEQSETSPQEVSFEKQLYPDDGGLTRDTGLMDLQSQFPFLPISPSLSSANSIWVPSDTCKEIRIPENARMMRVSFAGNAQVYIGRSQFRVVDSTYSHLEGDGIIVLKDPEWRYCAGMRSIWVMVSQASLVSVEYFVQL